MDETEIFLKLVYLEKENEIIVNELLSKLSVQHSLSTSQDPDEALAEVLAANPKDLTNLFMKNHHAKDKILQKGGKVKTSITIKQLDCQLTMNLLMHIKGLMPFRRSLLSCQSVTHKDCTSPNQHTCRKITINKSNKTSDYIPHVAWNTFHQCNSCKRNQIICSCCVCCSLCSLCGNCNKMASPKDQCSMYRLGNALQFILYLRNYASHLTKAKLCDFLNTNKRLEEFPTLVITTWEELTVAVKQAHLEVVTYLCHYQADPNYFKAQEENKLQNILDGVGTKETFWKYQEFVLEHLRRVDKVGELFIEVQRMISTQNHLVQRLFSSDYVNVSKPNGAASQILYDEHERLSWYHPNLDKQKANETLDHKPPGTYLLRQSKSCGDSFCLSIRKPKKCFHLRILSDDYGVFTFADGIIQKSFPSLSAACDEVIQSIKESGLEPIPLIADECTDYINFDGLSTEPPMNQVLPYYLKDTSKSTANKLLIDTRPGTYLLRESESKAGSFALTVRTEQSIEHFRISSNEQNQYTFQDSKNGMIFFDLNQAVRYFMDEWSRLNKIKPIPYENQQKLQ